jgi:repressor LexA
MSKETQGNRIKNARIAKGLTQESVAKYMDVTRNAVGAWENGRALPPAKNFPRLASFLGVSTAYLQMESDYPYGNEIPMPEDLLKIPIIATVKCGVNGLAFEEDGGFVNVEKKHGEDLRAFRCKGDSMINEGIHDGDVAIVRIQDTVESGELAIVVINGDEGTLKKVHIQKDAIILESANPAYPARVFTGVDRAIVHIVGKVIETRRKW